MNAIVRRATAADAAQMARVHVESWRVTFRGQVHDEVLDDPDLLPSREKFWTGALTDERWSSNRVAVAESDGSVVGIAMSGPALDGEEGWQLYVLYVDAAHHGTGTGAALLDAVLDPHERTVLWVAEPSPRAQAFYRKHGFRPEGVSRTEDGLRQIRCIRRGDDPQSGTK